MAHAFGIIISLPESKARQTRLTQHLESLDIAQHYSFFPALRGSPSAAERRGLSSGEDGLWRSVLAVLNQPQNGADYLHILEDDAELSPQFWQWLQQLQPHQNKDCQLLFTDMYAGATVYPKLLALTHQARKANRISWLIPQHQIPAVRRTLDHAYYRAQGGH